MRIITISREFGSGGRELGKRLADLLGYDYYDSEIISMVAKNCGMDPEYVEKALGNHGWQNQAISFRGTLNSAAYRQSSQVQLLLQQKKVIEDIGAMGKNCILVGRNADVLLKDLHPFTLFVCAETEAKMRRCRERALEGEQLSDRELLRKMKQIDKVRMQTREILSGAPWGQRDAYHMIVNTTQWNIKELTPAVGEFARRWFERDHER